MNREFKVRAWDKTAKRLICPEQIMQLNFNSEGIDWLGCWIVQPDEEDDPHQVLHQIPGKDLVLMQFIGLLDKNGQEIFDGDIVSFADWKPKIVVWNNEGVSPIAGFILKNTQLFLNRIDALDMQVIGNIHEHPELLEAKHEE